MARYVFFSSSADSKAVTAAKKVAIGAGASVVRTAVGSMLVEATPAKVTTVAKALAPEWRYTPEKKQVQLPERTPLQRARLAANQR